MHLFKGQSQTRRSDDTVNSSNKTVNSNNTNDITGNDNTVVEGDQKVFFKAGRDIHLNVYASSPATSRDYRVVDVEGTVMERSQSLELPSTNAGVTSSSDNLNQRDSQPTSYSNPGSHDSSQSAQSSVRWASDSIASSSRSGESKIVTSKNIENHLPEKAAAYIKSYMSMPLFNDTKIIPLWEPSPSLNDIHSHPRTRRKYVTIGDVGLFNTGGGFDTFFNIFLTFEENRALGYNPPPNFLRYCKLPDLRLRTEDVEGNETKPVIRWKGFVVCDESESPDHWVKLEHPEDKKAVKCSALNMAHGFHKITIDQFAAKRIEKWATVNQDEWHRHLDFATSNGHSKRFLLVITACYRAKSWASASFAIPPLSSQRKPLLLEKDSGNGINKGYTWSSWDQDIVKSCGPSSSQTEAMTSYFEDLDIAVEPRDSKTRKETEECNCIAVQAFFVQEKFLGIPLGSRRSTRSSIVTDNRSIFSRLTQRTVTRASPSEQRTIKATLKGVFKMGQ